MHDLGELHLEQVDLLAQDERQQQIERPGEDLEVELERGGGHPPQASAAAGRQTVVAWLFSSRDEQRDVEQQQSIRGTARRRRPRSSRSMFRFMARQPRNLPDEACRRRRRRARRPRSQVLPRALRRSTAKCRTARSSVRQTSAMSQRAANLRSFITWSHAARRIAGTRRRATLLQAGAVSCAAGRRPSPRARRRASARRSRAPSSAPAARIASSASSSARSAA